MQCIQKNDNIEIMINDKADEVIKKHFESLFSRYQIDVTEKKWFYLWLCWLIALQMS